MAKFNKERRDHSLSESSTSDDENISERETSASTSNKTKTEQKHSLSSSGDESSDQQSRSGDSDDDETENKRKKVSTLDESMYSRVKGKPSFSTKDITKDDEVWIVQCPKNVDASVFLNKKINFGGHSKLKLELKDGSQQKLEVVSEEVSKQFVTCVMKGPDRVEAVQLPLEGKLLITQKLAMPDIVFEECLHLCDKPDKIPLPQGLKLRHPLFGADYESRINPKKHKKKKRKEREDTSVAVLNESARKKMKRKLNEAEDYAATPPRRKKIKEEIESPDKSMYEQTEETSSHKKKKRKSKHHDE